MEKLISKKIAKVKRPMTIGLLGASLTTGNLGINALVCGNVTSVFHSYPSARCFLVDYEKEPATYQIQYPGGIAAVELVNLRFSKRFYLPNNIARLIVTALFLRIFPSRSLRSTILHRNRILKVIKEADVICSIAGGDSFSDIYGIGRLIYISLPQILVLLLKKPLMLLPQTIGPFKSTFAKTVARYILKRASIVFSRDYDGLNFTRTFLGRHKEKVQFCYDTGFIMHANISNERIPKFLTQSNCRAPLVGLNISGLLYMGGYNRKNMFGIKVEYKSFIFHVVEYLVRKKHVEVILFPHSYGKDENDEGDALACQKIYREIGNYFHGQLHLIEGIFNQHEIKALIGRCDFFLGSRMHACIAALSQCIPAVGLAYSRKFKGVFASIDMMELVIDLRDNDEFSIITDIEQLYKSRLQLRKKLERIMPTVRSSVLNIYSKHLLNTYDDPG